MGGLFNAGSGGENGHLGTRFERGVGAGASSPNLAIPAFLFRIHVPVKMMPTTDALSLDWKGESFSNDTQKVEL